jgi:hypothetical protein
MLAVRATAVHFSVSAARKAPKACGVPALRAEFGKSGRHRRRGQALVNSAIELADNTFGSAGGSNHADIGQYHVVRHAAFHHRRHLRNERVAPIARHRERPQCALPQQRKRAADVAEKHLHLPAQDAGNGIGGPLIGDVHDIDAGPEFEQFGCEVSGIAVTGGSVIELEPGFALA